MQEWMPMLRANALAAAGLAALVGILSPWLNRLPPWVGLLVAFVYVLVTQQWVSRYQATPPWKRPRKGSFKERQPSRREVLQWTLRVTALALSTQVVTFVAVYALISSLVWVLVR
ncbi:MAG: hypothetical protein L6E13_12455 [Firmicutes bacterium]|nr:hypothetical protein [Bacillota bacterium]